MYVTLREKVCISMYRQRSGCGPMAWRRYTDHCTATGAPTPRGAVELYGSFYSSVSRYNAMRTRKFRQLYY